MTDLDLLLKLTHEVAQLPEVTTAVDLRYCGNVSMRVPPPDAIRALISATNTDKQTLKPEEMVLIELCQDELFYHKDELAPSIDSLIHLKIYQSFPELSFLLHGHAYVAEAPAKTVNYYPCGDVREIEEVLPLIKAQPECGVINIQWHGFMFFARTIEQLQRLVSCAHFVSSLR